MNRSFQAIAALLVSLSGAMLAVTWTPAERQRHAPLDLSDCRLKTAAPCGYQMSAQELPLQQPVCEDAQPLGQPSSPSGPAWNYLPLSELDAAPAIWASRLGNLVSPRAVASTLSHGIHWLWPAAQEPLSKVAENQELQERQRVEAEYAAAELAAAGLRIEPWVTKGWEQASAAVLAGVDWQAHQSLYDQLVDNLESNYQIIIDGSWQNAIDAAAAHVAWQHQRLALREALLAELDRRFLEAVLEPDSRPAIEAPTRPIEPPTRQGLLAAADALKSLSRALQSLAENLESASRQDVAELHTPDEKRDEKR